MSPRKTGKDTHSAVGGGGELRWTSIYVSGDCACASNAGENLAEEARNVGRSLRVMSWRTETFQ